MSESRLSAETRTEFGKGGARRTRRAGKIPAVLYGHGTEPRHLSLHAREFAHAIKAGANTVLTLELEGGASELALAKSVVRHPLKDYVEHIDLVIVKRGEKVTVDVPVTTVGEPAPSTLLLVDSATVSIEVDALHIPSGIEVSVEGAEAGTQILAGALTLPSGAVLVTDPETLVVAVNTAQLAEVPEEDEAAEGEAAEGETAEAESSDES
ncbi:50S ribosomal protein L25/general stress protein Ctc [Nakamurella sp. YIM 132087]|uniref:Large ribosomal subunit protein bL25 n=1 Tax=Nakamurella alba TaxID=2665158 RepID=A0A7K1FF23_9ACTN|nr:50S ribosomal protein L25/general stress protein Ctc [Nakamurella alba]MTD12711.1 50S ribosomal protein L25/general stress protein Ctc [Nakamurella alba]